MLTQPYKQMWFVVLMAFVMGWSGIVSAAVKPAHDWMMSNHAVVSENRHSATAAHVVTSLADCHTPALQTHPETKQHLSRHDSNANQHLSQHTSVTDTDLNAADCYGSGAFSTANMNCQDCVQLHCQSLNSVLNVQVPELTQLVALTLSIFYCLLITLNIYLVIGSKFYVHPKLNPKFKTLFSFILRIKSCLNFISLRCF